MIRDSVNSIKAAGAILEVGYYLGLLAEALMRAGDLRQSLETVSEAITIAPDREVFLPYPLWVRGEIYLAMGAREEAERALRETIEFSGGIRDRMGVLRAANSLARILIANGRSSEGRQILAQASAGFESGFETPHIAAARDLLARENGLRPRR
jgi:tetratricopeptide (TPR) repeat protein